jgi:hypothetical protein
MAAASGNSINVINQLLLQTLVALQKHSGLQQASSTCNPPLDQHVHYGYVHPTLSQSMQQQEQRVVPQQIRETQVMTQPIGALGVLAQQVLDSVLTAEPSSTQIQRLQTVMQPAQDHLLINRTQKLHSVWQGCVGFGSRKQQYSQMQNGQMHTTSQCTKVSQDDLKHQHACTHVQSAQSTKQQEFYFAPLQHNNSKQQIGPLPQHPLAYATQQAGGEAEAGRQKEGEITENSGVRGEGAGWTVEPAPVSFEPSMSCSSLELPMSYSVRHDDVNYSITNRYHC